MSQLIAIASGKGGVGKTLITAVLAVLLQRRGHRVLAADADMGLRNLDLLFGLDGSIHYDAAQAARGKCLPGQALLTVTPGLDFLPASQKRTWERIDIPSYQYVLESLSGSYDYTLIDCPPGRDSACQAAMALADEILFVVEPSPSSLRDAAKVMQSVIRQKRFHYDVILNNFYADAVITPDTAKACLPVDHLAGLLPHDDGIDRAAGEGRIASAADSLPFCQALSATAAWLETGRAIEETALTALLPRHQAQSSVLSGLSLHRRRQECQNWRHYRR